MPERSSHLRMAASFSFPVIRAVNKEALKTSQPSKFRSTNGCFRSKTASLPKHHTVDNIIPVKAPHTQLLLYQWEELWKSEQKSDISDAKPV